MKINGHFGYEDAHPPINPSGELAPSVLGGAGLSQDPEGRNRVLV